MTCPEPDPDVASRAERLGLAAHPEGGWYRRVWTSANAGPSGRPTGSAIQYLLEEGMPSRWHRIDASEVWVHAGGAPIRLSVSDGSVVTERVTIGDDLPQFVVQPGMWQSAATTDAWSLAVCVVVPGFEWEGFEMAPPDWSPSDS